MALRLKFFLNGQEIKEPLNYQETSLELNFDKDDPSYAGEVSTNSWILGTGNKNDAQDGAKELIDYANGGLNLSTPGVFGGVSYQIQLIDGVDNPFIYDGYIDLSKGVITCQQIEAPSSESKNIDWLNNIADSFTFEKLYQDGIITKNDFALIPYQEYKPGDRVQGVMVLLTMVSIAFQLFSFINILISTIVSFTSSAGWDWPRIAQIINLILALTQLIINIYIFIDQVSRYLLNPVKYKAGMYLYDLCRIGSEYLGYTFESPILDGTDSRYRLNVLNRNIGFNNVVLIPQSYAQEEKDEDGTLGVTDVRDIDKLRGYYRGTFGDLLRQLKTMFNAKIIIQERNGGKVLKLDRIDQAQTTNQYQIPPIDRTNTPYRYNYEELYSHYGISFAKDDQDKVSLQNYAGTEFNVFTNPLIKADNYLQPGVKLNQLEFGLTVIKNELTKQEKFLKKAANLWYGVINAPFLLLRGFVIAINALIKGINKILKVLRSLGIFKKKVQIKPISLDAFRNPLQEFKDYYNNQRLGILQFESDFLSIPKLVALETNVQKFRSTGGAENRNKGYKPSVIQRLLLSGGYLYGAFHYINNFIEDPILPYQDHNQHLIYELDNIPFCYEDYKKVRDDNGVIDSDGITTGKIISLKWNIYNRTASIKFKVKKKYTNNLEIQSFTSDGK